MTTKIVNNKSNTISDQALLKQAIKALKLSYSPYSQFSVGAAILTSRNKIFLGTNIENASYPLCICAERTAISNYHVHDPKATMKAIAIISASKVHPNDRHVYPCGACRQVIAEFESKQKRPIKIILGALNSKEIIVYNSIHELLPYSFDRSWL